MLWPVLALGAVVALAAGALLLRRTGLAYRVGRLLGAAPEVSVAELAGGAAQQPPLYVRTHGRISSDEEFPDELERPLVYRRRRLERADDGGRWKVLDEDRQAVPFGVESRDAFIAVDADALGDGLVVVPRESTGRAADLPGELRAALPAPVPDDTPIRLRIEQVSAVEHATVAGVPERGADGQVRLTAGLGRPLILSTLPSTDAMRLLASGRRGSVVLAAVLLVSGLGLLALASVALLLGR